MHNSGRSVLCCTVSDICEELFFIKKGKQIVSSQKFLSEFNLSINDYL